MGYWLPKSPVSPLSHKHFYKDLSEVKWEVLGFCDTTGSLRGRSLSFPQIKPGRLSPCLEVLTFKGRKNLAGVGVIKWGVAMIWKQSKHCQQMNTKENMVGVCIHIRTHTYYVYV